jgi:hypothetical protein
MRGIVQPTLQTVKLSDLKHSYYSQRSSHNEHQELGATIFERPAYTLLGIAG